MKPGGSMPHSQGLSNNPYPEPNQNQFIVLIPISLRSILVLSSDNNVKKQHIHK